jgi:hypothetical protein
LLDHGCKPAILGQTIGLPGNHDGLGRESGGVDVVDQLAEEVGVAPKPAVMHTNLLVGHSDMNHSNMYAVGLALCTFANIAGEEMSRDLVNEIEKLLGSSNTYIRKKVSSRKGWRTT